MSGLLMQELITKHGMDAVSTILECWCKQLSYKKYTRMCFDAMHSTVSEETFKEYKEKLDEEYS